MNTTPIILTGTPEENWKSFIVNSLETFYDWDNTETPAAYAGIDSNEDLSLEYETTGQICSIETTGFLDQTSNQRRYFSFPNSQHVLAPGERLILKLTNGDITTGNVPLKIKLRLQAMECIS